MWFLLLELCNINCLFFQALEEQISQEDSSSRALREEVLAKEQNMSELHTAMKEVRDRQTSKMYPVAQFDEQQL